MRSNQLYTVARRSSLLWEARDAHTETRPILGFLVRDTTVCHAVGDICAAAIGRRRLTIAFLNAHSVNSSIADPSYGRVLAAADWRLADGSGMAIAACLAGRRLSDNVNGTDLLPKLAERAAQLGLSLFLLGGVDGIAAATADNLMRRFPTLRIAGAHAGFFEPASVEERRTIAAINTSGADILLVGMGVPRQDVWLAEHRSDLLVPVRIGVGGLFDFFADRVSRAPTALRSIGLEWVWRFIQEPGRLWRRYLVGNVIFLLTALAAAVSQTYPSRMPRYRYIGLRLRAKLAVGRVGVIKRMLDILGSVAGLVALAPLLAAVAVLIKLDSRGPVIFRQKRIGLNGRTFEMKKFRTMRVGADREHAVLQGEVRDAHDIRFKAKADPRVTRVGRHLRRWSIDELPQLWNVLVGDMSLVGPRPALPSEVARYSIRDKDRLLAMPGITGSWQVGGRADIDFVGQVALDRAYVRAPSILADTRILLRTLPAIVSHRGAY